MRFAPALFGLIIPLVSLLVLVVAINQLNAYADTTFQIVSMVNSRWSQITKDIVAKRHASMKIAIQIY
ncbi:MAG: hypothetical protein QOK84_03920 [Nitrososphaeraceae archaeon]|nr:hypothetical protein [Nitrososphaeraceae archaeon]